MLRQPRQQAIEEYDIGARTQGQVQIGAGGCLCAARVYDHQPQGGIGRARGIQALEQHRVAPGQVGPGQHYQVGQFQVRVAAGHQVLTKGALVTGDRRGHAQA